MRQNAYLLPVVDASIEPMFADGQPASLLPVVDASIEPMFIDGQPASLLPVVDASIEPMFIDGQPASLLPVVDATAPSLVACVADQNNDNIIDERSLSMSRKIAKKRAG